MASNELPPVMQAQPNQDIKVEEGQIFQKHSKLRTKYSKSGIDFGSRANVNSRQGKRDKSSKIKRKEELNALQDPEYLKPVLVERKR